MKKILLVEDNADIRELACLALARAGYEVFEAENGREALELLETTCEQPCLVLIDLMMPVMSGAELLQAMQQNPRLASLRRSAIRRRQAFRCPRCTEVYP